MPASKPAVIVKDLYKSFKLPHEKHNGLKQIIVNIFNRKSGYESQHVLSDISFEIEEGDFFGIVGRNGSGKSTLLKLLASIYTPDKGSVQVNGSLTPFIELGVGFNPELTGRENVYMNGALLGFDRNQMDEMYDEIVDFAELERFMDQKLKNYSSGMQVRLAFSIAIRAKSDILLLDEVLAVGDESFQRKCYAYFSELKRNKKTVILVTHDMGAVEKYCNKALMIEKGKIVKRGSNFEVAAAYRELFMNDRSSMKKSEVKSTRKVSAVTTRLIDEKGGKIDVLHPRQPWGVMIEYTYHGTTSVEGAIGLSIRNAQGVAVIATGTGTIHDGQYTLFPGHNTAQFLFDENILTNDDYTVDIAIAEGQQNGYQDLIYQESNANSFQINGFVGRTHSLIHPKTTIRTSHE